MGSSSGYLTAVMCLMAGMGPDYPSCSGARNAWTQSPKSNLSQLHRERDNGCATKAKALEVLDSPTVDGSSDKLTAAFPEAILAPTPWRTSQQRPLLSILGKKNH